MEIPQEAERAEAETAAKAGAFYAWNAIGGFVASWLVYLFWWTGDAYSLVGGSLLGAYAALLLSAAPFFFVNFFSRSFRRLLKEKKMRFLIIAFVCFAIGGAAADWLISLLIFTLFSAAMSRGFIL